MSSGRRPFADPAPRVPHRREGHGRALAKRERLEACRQLHHELDRCVGVGVPPERAAEAVPHAERPALHPAWGGHAKTWPDPGDEACDIMLEDFLGRPPYPLRGFILDGAPLALEDERRRAPYAGRRVGEAANPGPVGSCALVCAPQARWRAFPRLSPAVRVRFHHRSRDVCTGCPCWLRRRRGSSVIGPSRACWAGRSLPVGPRREAFFPAGGPTAWERAGRHAGKGWRRRRSRRSDWPEYIRRAGRAVHCPSGRGGRRVPPPEALRCGNVPGGTHEGIAALEEEELEERLARARRAARAVRHLSGRGGRRTPPPEAPRCRNVPGGTRERASGLGRGMRWHGVPSAARWLPFGGSVVFGGRVCAASARCRRRFRLRGRRRR